MVHTETGSPQIFDEVVMTAPLGWLKRNQAAFVPALPSHISKAIDSLGYGHLEKVGSLSFQPRDSQSLNLPGIHNLPSCVLGHYSIHESAYQILEPTDALRTAKFKPPGVPPLATPPLHLQ